MEDREKLREDIGIFGNPGPVGKAILKDLKKEGLLKNRPEGNDADKPARRRTA